MKSNPVLQKQLDSHFNVKAEISEVPLYRWLSYPLWASTALFPGMLFIIRKHHTGQDELIEPVLLSEISAWERELIQTWGKPE